MKNLFLFIVFSSLLFSERNIPFCKPFNGFCIKITGIPSDVYQNEYIKFWVSIKNISGKDFDDEEVKFFIGINSGTLKVRKYKKDDYIENVWDGREWFNCKKWRAGEERQMELEILDFNLLYPNYYDYKSAVQYLPRLNYLYIQFVRPYYALAQHAFYTRTYPPNYETGIEIFVEGPDVVTNGTETIFKFKVKNKTNTFFKKSGDYPKITAIFGRKDYERSDISSFEILEKYPNNDVVLKTLDEVFNTSLGYYILEMSIGDFAPEGEAYLKLKIKYEKSSDDYAYIYYYHLISPLVCYFSYIKESENNYTIRTSSGKGLWIYHPLKENGKIFLLNEEILFGGSYEN